MNSDIEVSEEEAAQQVVEMRAVYKNDPKALEQLKNPDVATGIRNRMRIDKTMNKLVEINKPHAKKPAKKAAAKKSDKIFFRHRPDFYKYMQVAKSQYRQIGHPLETVGDFLLCLIC